METERQLTVLGSFGLRPSERMTGVGRCVMAHLALRGRRQMRSLVYSDLWPEVPEARARANLRRALWQLPRSW